MSTIACHTVSSVRSQKKKLMKHAILWSDLHFTNKTTVRDLLVKHLTDPQAPVNKRCLST